VSRGVEISGDAKLSPFRRIKYFCDNALRNLAVDGPLTLAEFFDYSLRDFSGCPSPGRLLTENHLRYFLPTVLPIGDVRVLDIGCGSGRLCLLLAELGYSGQYVGLDVNDRFDIDPVRGFERELVIGDAHDFEGPKSRFDLIVSISSLEHIPNDRQLINRLPEMLKPGGVELHYVPTGWGLLAYLWHGYRQYPLRYIGKTFGRMGVKVYALGGLFSFCLHFTLITVSEVLMRIRMRDRFPKLYRWLLRRAVANDRYLRLGATIFAICRKNSSA
jgi:SAM-dependent methyltransferase